MDNEGDQVVKAIWHYQERLGKYASNGSDEKLLYTIGKLKKLPIKTAHLENTGVGRTVNGLKKLGGDVGEAAKNLVALWKEMVLQEEQKAEEEEEEQSNDVDSSYSSESESNKLKIDEPLLKSVDTPAIKEARESYIHEDNYEKDSYRSGKGNARSSNKEEKSHCSNQKEKQRNGKDHSRASNREEKSSQYSKADGEKSDKHRENKHSSSSHSKSSKNSDRDKSESSHKSSSNSKEKDKPIEHNSRKRIEVDKKHTKRDSTSSSESEYESEVEHNDAKKKHASTSGSESDRRHSSDRESSTSKKRHDSSSSTDEEEYDRKKQQISRSREKLDKRKTSEDDKRSKKKRRHSESSEDKESENNKKSSSNQGSSKSKEKSTRKRDEYDEKHLKKKRHHSSESSDDADNSMKKNEKQSNRESSKLKEKSSRKREDLDDNRHSKKKRPHSSDGSDEEKVEKKSKTVESRDSKSKDKSSKSSKQEDTNRLKDRKSDCDKDRKRENSKNDGKSRNERDSSKSHSSTSSKDKDTNRHKDEKKGSSSSKSKSKSEQKTDKDTRIKVPKASDMKKIVNGIDSGSGASFAEALGLCGPPVAVKTSSGGKKKSAEKSGKTKDHSGPSKKKMVPEHSEDREAPLERDFDETDDEENVPALLKQSQLEPLNINMSSLLPEITPNYRPLGISLDSQLKRFERMTDDEALSRVMTNKNYRTKVYSGNKMFGKVDTLFDLCVRILQDNIDALEYTGGVPYSILKPVLEKATPDQLFNMEHHNPYLIEETDELWQLHCQKEFRTKKREELESWREMYMRCLDEREARLNAITANIKQAQDKSLPVRTTKLAYVDSVVKPPRNIAKKQAKNGIIPDKKMVVTPADRLAQLAKSGEAAKVAVPNPGARVVERSSSSSSTATLKHKKAPLMAKTLSFMKNRFKR